MSVLQVAKALAIAGVSASLIGCGGNSTPAPTPAPTAAPTPYSPTTVSIAWKNHFDAFGAVDVEKIMLDYTEESVLSIFNDKCDGQKTGGDNFGFTEHKGTVAIKAFFTSLFEQLKQSLADSQVAVTGADLSGDNPAPRVVEDTSGIAGANVFLTWTAAAANPVIEWATDSFSFKKDDGKFTIHKQNIVGSIVATCEASKSVTGTTDTPITDLTTLNPCDGITTGLCGAWNNHFAGFGNQSLDIIMDDYVETSVVQIFDARTKALTGDHTGKTAIRGMFDGLFTQLGAVDNGVDVKLLEVHEATKTVFLVWVSNEIPQATDTFIFDDNNKIITQNIQVYSKVEAASMVV